MTEFLIGVDGGGSGTRARIAHANEPDKSLGLGHAGPSALRQGVDNAWAQIDLAIRAAFADAKLPVPTWSRCALGAGLSGVSARALREQFIAQNPGFSHLTIDTDGFVTLLGAHGGAPGAVVAIGTGSVGEVLRADGSREVVSGWGFPVGDEGSGAWMGLHAMQVAQAAMDRRTATGALAQHIWATAGANREALQAWSSSAGQYAYAQLAPIVFDTAAEDAAAENILREATTAIETIIRTLDRDAQLPMVIAGSLGTRLSARLSTQLRSNTKLVAAQADAAAGALTLIATHLKRNAKLAQQ